MGSAGAILGVQSIMLCLCIYFGPVPNIHLVVLQRSHIKFHVHVRIRVVLKRKVGFPVDFWLGLFRVLILQGNLVKVILLNEVFFG